MHAGNVNLFIDSHASLKLLIDRLQTSVLKSFYTDEKTHAGRRLHIPLPGNFFYLRQVDIVTK